MGKALYRKYRSKSLGEIVGQEHITTTLKNAVERGKISHAYLFTGPRGVGKTSVARILAHVVNDLPYNTESSHLDIIEIDAASNRRIDEIRELRERIGNAPSSAKYKVYIIDEVHMLTREAFNALLKTLEEPPEHVIFILATTEAHKLPDTIISRTQRFTFKPIDTLKAVKHLQEISNNEKIKVTPEALELIARHGDGSFRDSISLLEQAAANGDEVTASVVGQILGEVPEEAITNLVEAVSKGSTGMVLEYLSSFKEQGYQAGAVAKQIAKRLRRGLVENNGTIDPKTSTGLLAKLLEIPAAHDSEGLLELYLLEAALANSPKSPKATSVINDVAVVQNEEKPAQIAKNEVKMQQKVEEKLSGKFREEHWDAVLNQLKTTHNTLYSLARMGSPFFSDSSLTLEFTFPFHQKRLNESRNKEIITSLIKEISGHDIDVICIVGTKSVPISKPEVKSVNRDSLQNISNIFGSAEVLE